jgi:hypothetical protein
VRPREYDSPRDDFESLEFAGLIYLYDSLPFHHFVFADMRWNLSRAAECFHRSPAPRDNMLAEATVTKANPLGAQLWSRTGKVT